MGRPQEDLPGRKNIRIRRSIETGDDFILEPVQPRQILAECRPFR
jgi:hypothetical protein